MDAYLTFQGHFLITAGSGFGTPDHHFVKSFKLFDTNKPI